MSRAMSFMSDQMSDCQGATAPWSIVSESSGTSVDSSTARTTPVPSHVRQAPAELNARSSAPGPKNFAPHSGHTISRSAATSIDGGQRWPLGQRCEPQREKRSRRELSSSVPVPKVERMPGTDGRWCSASAAGTWRTSSTSAFAAWVMRRRV